MSADFWSGYASGAIGIIIGNPLDLIKTRLQAAPNISNTLHTLQGLKSQFDNASSLVRGAMAPVLGYGALNALLFVAYNRSLTTLAPEVTNPTEPDGVSLSKIWLAGAVGGMASWVVSSPTELVKCRAQLATDAKVNSWTVSRDIVKQYGLRGLYYAGAVTGVRDAVGYGFYFWAYELCKRSMVSIEKEESNMAMALKVLLCGGIAGITTWASVFPLDVIKTRLQAQRDSSSTKPLMSKTPSASPGESRRLTTWEMIRSVYQTEGVVSFYRGLGICSLRAFMVNAAQWAVYEWMMKSLTSPAPQSSTAAVVY
ncbi:hypothetical protein KEM54_002042 [Ascosphaera aggregata]|nr:hypothetical protein KEM54_002042 [Ascosphaera aggregata]